LELRTCDVLNLIAPSNSYGLITIIALKRCEDEPTLQRPGGSRKFPQPVVRPSKFTLIMTSSRMPCFSGDSQAIVDQIKGSWIWWMSPPNHMTPWIFYSLTNSVFLIPASEPWPTKPDSNASGVQKQLRAVEANDKPKSVAISKTIYLE
jgi:hypothetical protein